MTSVTQHPPGCACPACGEPISGLDFGYTLPDCIWNQPAHQRSSRNNTDFAELGKRRFVRGLLPVKIATGDEFRYGVWLEVRGATFDKIVEVWNDPQRYPKLKFTARIANAVPPWKAKILDVEVDAGVRDQGSRPFVIASAEKWLQALLTRGWTRAEYEAIYAELQK